MENQAKPTRHLDYKWVIIALCFLMVSVCLGFCSSPKSLYLSAITEALGIKRSAFSIGDSCRFISTAVINLFFGKLVHKFGTKKLIAAGFAALIGSCVLYALSTHIIGFYLGGCLLGLGLSWTTTTMVGAIVGKWCKEGKGTIMGFILASNGLGGALAVQILSPIIYQEGNAFGYRSAYFLVAGILLAVCIIVMIFYRESPKGQPAEEQAPQKARKKARGQSWSGIAFDTAKRQPYFYLALICIFLTGLILQSVNGISAVHMKDAGLDPAWVATMLSVHSLALAGFKFLAGFMYDKLGLRVTATICDATAVLVMVCLALVSNSPTGMIMAGIYAIFSGLALPLETIMLPIFAGDLFGDHSYYQIMGIFVSVNTAGYAVGAPLANWCFDQFGSYKPMLLASAVAMVAVTVVFQFVITAANRRRKAVTEQGEPAAA